VKPELIPIRRLASGETLHLPVFRFEGRSGGGAPSAYLQASLHGSEVQGNWVIAELLERLPALQKAGALLGDITLVPCANPHAQNQKMGDYTIGRYDPTDGDNWNRAFQNLSSLAAELSGDWPEAKTAFRKKLIEKLSETPAHAEGYSKRLARELQKLAAGHDLMLDLHCAALCESYAYVPEYCFESFRHLPCRHAVRIPEVFTGAMDEAFVMPWWALGRRVQQVSGKFPELPEGFTLELGHQDWCEPELAARQAEGILHYLSVKGTVKGAFEAMKFGPRYACDLKDFHTDYSPTAGFVKLKAPLGEPSRAGDPYCEFLGFKDFRREKIACGEDRVTLVFTNSSSVHEGTELGKSLTRYYPV
jgi:predicted deacylase